MAGGPRILVLDGDAGDRSLAAFVLARAVPDAAVEAVADAAAFALAALGEPVAVVVTAADLGWSDAPSVIDAVRIGSPDCRFVLFSAPGCDDHLSAALDRGLDRYVPKSSAGFLRLAETVAALLGTAVARPEAAARRDERPAPPPSTGPPAGAVPTPGPLPTPAPREERDVRRITAALSRDLSPPLALVSRYARLLGDAFGERLGDHGRRWVAQLVASTERMQALVDDVLAYARVDEDDEPVAPVPFGAAAERALAALAAAVAEAGARVEVGHLPTLPARAGQIRQLFENLIANALQFRGEAPPHVRITSAPSNGGWVIAVRDDGIGVPAAEHERIFELFQRIPGTSDYPGAGVGLAICRRIAERHGGRIWVESAPGEGATFQVLLPTRPVAPPPREGRGAGDGPTATRRAPP